MTYSDATFASLKMAFYKFDRQLGKWDKQNSLTLLDQLGLESQAHEIVKATIIEAFEKDAFAGMLRLAAVSNRLQAEIRRAGGPAV